MYIYIHIYIKEQDRNFYSSTILYKRSEHKGRNKTINFAKWGPIIFLLTKNIDKKINTINIQAIHLYATPFVNHFIIISLSSLPPALPTSVSSSALSGCVVLYLQGQSQPFLNGEGGVRKSFSLFLSRIRESALPISQLMQQTEKINLEKGVSLQNYQLLYLQV